MQKKWWTQYRTLSSAPSTKGHETGTPFWSKEIAHNRDNDAWKEQREWRKRQGAEIVVPGKHTRTDNEPQQKTKQQGEPTSKQSAEASQKCFYFVRKGSCSNKRCERLHEPASPGE